MARTAVNLNIASGTPYTVPANKQMIGKAFTVATNSTLAVDGVTVSIMALASSNNPEAGPIVLNAGSVLSAPAGNYGFSGFLYDV